MDYMGPAPPKGTHRYIFTLWWQVLWWLVLSVSRSYTLLPGVEGRLLRNCQAPVGKRA